MRISLPCLEVEFFDNPFINLQLNMSWCLIATVLLMLILDVVTFETFLPTLCFASPRKQLIFPNGSKSFIERP